MREADNGHESMNHPVLGLMVVIVDWNRVNKVKELLRKQYVRFQYVCVGEGTANSEFLDVMGIGSVNKGVILCLQPEFRMPDLMKLVSEQLGMDKSWNGIAFTMPLSGIINPAAFLFSEEKISKLSEMFDPGNKEKILNKFRRNGRMGMENQMETTKINEVEHDLVVSVLNRGYSEDLMSAAKASGARGGTIIHANRIGIEDTVKFFGISVQAEKEVIIILTKRDKKNDIMKAINKGFGMSTEAKALVFSLPVDSVAGLNN